MADCFPPESDDFHRRWLPREILADIGIADPEAVGAETPPEAAAAAAVEELAAQLAGILGGGAKAWPLGPPPQPPTPAAPPVAAAAVAPCYGAKVCGLQGSVVVSCGETNGGGAVSWPFVPYPPQLHWQVGSGLVNHGGVLDYPVLPPAALPCHVPPPANLRGGTGVFLPRIEAYRYAAAPPATAKGGAATKPWAGTGSRPATGKKQERQQAEQAAPAAKHPQKQRQQQQQATGAALALPQDWCYR
ncbi:uncharacterized protein LOC100278089 [Zea mays]|uniref:Uncharacterized protein n=1 Tax=Zea mays TaxID=4577 RepID=B6U3S4_MAIZE|nr:uncharacterized protein LOC100278089 [Zea mays]ACG44007.1 hypothetical protein [Zea mays]|eukprot:NP_001144953.1 uncharacterized protein LOC100278089 [Zea mays]